MRPPREPAPAIAPELVAQLVALGLPPEQLRALLGALVPAPRVLTGWKAIVEYCAALGHPLCERQLRRLKAAGAPIYGARGGGAVRSPDRSLAQWLADRQVHLSARTMSGDVRRCPAPSQPSGKSGPKSTRRCPNKAA